MNDNSTAPIDKADNAPLRLHGLGTPTLPFVPVVNIAMGETPAERASVAAGIVLDAMYEAYARARRQTGGEPVMVVASADAKAGRGLIVKRFGLDIVDALSAPLVWAWSEKEAAAELGALGWKQLSDALDKIGHADGGMRVLFAVNGQAIEARVFRRKMPFEIADLAVADASIAG